MNVLILAAEEAEVADGGASLLLPHLNELVPGLIAFALIFSLFLSELLLIR